MDTGANGQTAYRVVDLFCGMGGLSLGLERSGLHVVGGMDIWKDATETYRYNLGHPCLTADILQVGPEQFLETIGASREEIHVMAGGPPCQGFSTVGKRDDSDPRNKLVFRYLEYVSYIRPHYVVIENVGGILLSKNGGVVKDIVDAFAQVGYHIKYKEMISAKFGVPQLRKRVIFLGWRDGVAEPNFPNPTVEVAVSVGDAIFDLPEIEAGASATNYTTPATTNFQKTARNGTSILCNHEAASHPAHLIEILRHIPDGGNRRSIPDELQPKSGFHNSYARLSSTEPAVAITSNMRKPSSARCTHPRQNRGLTVREGLRLQSFPDSFVVKGTRTSQYLQVGNAVPPLLAEAVGKSILSALGRNSSNLLSQIKDTEVQAIETYDGVLQFS
jgi:DNA (cytosine-5)-methyltransferase 1